MKNEETLFSKLPDIFLLLLDKTAFTSATLAMFKLFPVITKDSRYGVFTLLIIMFIQFISCMGMLISFFHLLILLKPKEPTATSDTTEDGVL